MRGKERYLWYFSMGNAFGDTLYLGQSTPFQRQVFAL